MIYYLNMSSTVVYPNKCDLSINRFKFIINWDSIIYNNILSNLRYMIDVFITIMDRSKISMDWERISSSEKAIKRYVLWMNSNRQGRVNKGYQQGGGGQPSGENLHHRTPMVNPHYPKRYLNPPGIPYIVNGSNQPLATNLANELLLSYRIDVLL